MSTNCKIGDLAIITEAAPKGDYRGLIVEVLEYRGTYDYVSHFPDQLPGTVRWLVRSARPVICVSGVSAREFQCADVFMRPIRDPGDSAVDEIIQRIGIAPATPVELLEWSK